jgi:hypothetical protein
MVSCPVLRRWRRPAPGGHFFDRQLGCLPRRELDDPVHIDSGQVNVVRIDLARFDQFVDLRDGDAPGHGGDRVEVSGGFLEHEVAVAVAARSAHQRVVRDDGLLEHVFLLATEGGERTRLLRRGLHRDLAIRPVAPRQAALGDHGSDAAGGEERRDAGASGAQPLGQRALGRQLDLELATQVPAGEVLVLTDVRGDDPADPAL